jgi:hypothetical protein
VKPLVHRTLAHRNQGLSPDRSERTWLSGAHYFVAAYRLLAGPGHNDSQAVCAVIALSALRLLYSYMARGTTVKKCA